MPFGSERKSEISGGKKLVAKELPFTEYIFFFSLHQGDLGEINQCLSNFDLYVAIFWSS